MKQMENVLDTILLSLPESDRLSALRARAERRQERIHAENLATAEYEQLKSRMKELENDYPILKKL
jgi:hypothetical protein